MANPATTDIIPFIAHDANSVGIPSGTTPDQLFASTGVGYGKSGIGQGGAVTQGTSRTTAVTLNTYSGAITMFTAAGSATPATFTVNNSKVGANDTIDIHVGSGSSNLYQVFVTALAAGSFNVTFFTTGGTASDTPVLNFSINKGSAS